MKSGSQFLIAVRLLNTAKGFPAKLSLNSKSVQVNLYCYDNQIVYVESTDYFPASWLTKQGMNDLAMSLAAADSVESKLQLFRTVTDNADLKTGLTFAVRNHLRTVFESEPNECKLKLEQHSQTPGILNLVDFYFDCAAVFVQSQQLDDLIPNEQITFQVAPDYIQKSTALRITSQHGYLLSRLEKPVKLAEIYSMIPGDEQTIRRNLLDLWAFGVLDSQVLNQYVPKVDRPLGPTVPTPENMKELVAAVNQTYLSLSRKDFYGLLGTGPHPDLAEIKSAYYKLAKKFHPDRFYGMEDPVLKEKVDVIFAAINVAYETLKNSKKRTEYDNAPADKRVISSTTIISDVVGETQKAPPGPDKVKWMADDYARQAQKSYEEGNHLQAVQYLRSATKIAPHVAKYWRLLGISCSKNPQWRKEAEDSFYHAIELEPKSPDNHLHLAMLYKNSGLKLRAKKHFNSCLQLDPRNDTAARELIELEADEERDQKKGRLGGLFKKK
jgi:curved DNA-binding protein CbpA